MKPRMEKALTALISRPTIAEAAKAAGVSERTMQRYLKDGEFAEQYREAVRKVSDEAAARLILSMGRAVGALDSICQDSEAPPHARVQAANSILSHGLRAIDKRTIEMSGPVPTFVFEPEKRSAPTLYLGVNPKRYGPTIAPEVYEEVKRLLELGDDERTNDEQEES